MILENVDKLVETKKRNHVTDIALPLIGLSIGSRIGSIAGSGDIYHPNLLTGALGAATGLYLANKYHGSKQRK